MKIYPKLDFGKIYNSGLVQTLVNAGFDGIELYTASSGENGYDNFRANTPIIGREDFAIKSIHAPIAFSLDGKTEKFNLVYEDRIADKSLELLVDVANFANRQNCQELTIHSWFINPPYEITKSEAHRNMAKNLAKIRSDIKDVRILAEVSPLVLWGFPDVYNKQTVMVTPEDYKELFSEGDKHGLNLGWDADIDHMFRTAFFAKLYGNDGKEYFKKAQEAKSHNYEGIFREEVCKAFLERYKDWAYSPYSHLKLDEGMIPNKFIYSMLTSLYDRIGHVSVSGADFVLGDVLLLPNEGMSFEHLPVNFQGKVTARNYSQGFKPVDDKAVNVGDRINHESYIHLVKDKPLILEFSSREPPFQKLKDYDFVEQCIAQKQYLESLVK